MDDLIKTVCTYKGCDNMGVGRPSETAVTWLCEQHLTAVKEATERFAKSGTLSDMKLMLGHIARALNGCDYGRS